MDATLSDRTYLHDRHRLSHQQIDSWLGENSSKDFLWEKLRSLEFVGYFLSVTDTLRKSNIPFVCLKGPILSYRIYKEPSVRISHDIDILIEVEMVETVVDIFLENGFVLSNGAVWPQKKLQQELIVNTDHHLSFQNKKFGYIVEIHWTLMQGLAISQSMLKSIIAGNLTEETLSGRKFTVLSREFELLFLLIHGSRHGWSRLKWLVDIKEYPVADLDYEKFYKLARQLKAGRIIGQANHLLNEFFNVRLPFEGDVRLPVLFIRFAHKSIKGEIKEKQSIREMLNLFCYLLLMFRGVRYKSKVINGFFLRSGDFTAIDSSFRVVYYLYRPYSFIKRRLFYA